MSIRKSLDWDRIGAALICKSNYSLRQRVKWEAKILDAMMPLHQGTQPFREYLLNRMLERFR